jgi:hypothetical protein
MDSKFRLVKLACLGFPVPAFEKRRLCLLEAARSRPYPTRATRLHQEAIYQILAGKYFGGEGFFGQGCSINAVLARGGWGAISRRRRTCPPLSPARKSKMTNNSDHAIAIIRFNEKTYVSGGVVAVVKGTESAQRALNDFEWCQSQEDRSSGWRYFLEETDLQPGTDPAKATRLRQLRLDLQESRGKRL